MGPAPAGMGPASENNRSGRQAGARRGRQARVAPPPPPHDAHPHTHTPICDTSTDRRRRDGGLLPPTPVLLLLLTPPSTTTTKRLPVIKVRSFVGLQKQAPVPGLGVRPGPVVHHLINHRHGVPGGRPLFGRARSNRGVLPEPHEARLGVFRSKTRWRSIQDLQLVLGANLRRGAL